MNTIVFEDEIEDKKIRSLVTSVNDILANAVVELDAFENFANSQLSGAYNHKLVMAKSLRHTYDTWGAVATAYENLQREETTQVNNFYAFKTKLISSLNELLKVCAKSPVVSTYDVYKNKLKKCEEGHNIIILGTHNTDVITTIIEDLEKKLTVSGHFTELDPQDLTANYSIVDKNVQVCTEKLNEMYGNKPGKLQKFLDAVNKMEEIGQKVVFYLTYKADLENIGCPKKELDLYEKNLVKNYMPLKKLLQKTCRYDFEEICDIVVDENDFATADEENLDATLVNEESETVVEDNADAATAAVEFTQEETEGEPFDISEMVPAEETSEEEISEMVPAEETSEEEISTVAKKFDFKGLANKVNAAKSDEEGTEE